MTVRFRIIPELRLIVTAYHGVVSGEDYLETYQTIFTQPDYRPGMDELCDTRPMQVFDIQLSTIKRVAAWVAEQIGPSTRPMRTAVIQGSDANSGVSKLYGAVAEMFEKEALVLFPTLDEATAWLELDKAAIPLIEDVLKDLGKRE